MPPSIQPSDIPVATDGNVITSDYHNSLRTAVLVLANLFDSQQPRPSVTVTVVPAFAVHGAGPAWVIDDGYAGPAAGGTAGGSADGILPVQLPDGMSLDSMTVIGRRNGQVGGFDVLFSRQLLSTVRPTPLIALDLSGAADPFSVSSGINITDPGAGGPEAYKVINNSKFKYFVTASISGAAAAGKFFLYAFQFKCVS
jgi:hypothetical protein